MFTDENKAIWITWEDHRRTQVLAKQFGINLVVFKYSGLLLIRYLVLSLRTTIKIVKYRPKLLIVQNPSIILSLIVSIIKPLMRYRLIVDRHSNFKFSTQLSSSPKWKLFHWISHFTIKAADLTIVTNSFLKEYVNNKGGRGFVLQDKIPNFPVTLASKDSNTAVFISTFSGDEPFQAFIEAASFFKDKFIFFITGNYNKALKKGLITLSELPQNIKLTGFLPEKDYIDLLNSSDFNIVITLNDYTLNCGAYESVALQKPMILGNTSTIKEYFSKGAVYTNSTVESFCDSINTITSNINQYRHEVGLLKTELENDWNKRFLELMNIISSWDINIKQGSIL